MSPQHPPAKDGDERELTPADLFPTTTDAEKRRPFITPRYDSERDDTKVRGRIAQWLVALLATVIVVGLVATVTLPDTADEIETYLTMALPALVGLVGAATGFYFGDRRKR